MGTTLEQFQSCSVWGCLESLPEFVTAKAALDSDRVKVSCSMVSPCNIIIMLVSVDNFFVHGQLILLTLSMTLNKGIPISLDFFPNCVERSKKVSGACNKLLTQTHQDENTNDH